MCLQKEMSNDVSDSGSQILGQINLYGETHSAEKILDKELELWGEHYQNQGLRHLFIEMPYYTAEFLNLWMQSDNDELLDDIYNEWIGTRVYNPDIKKFYKKLKVQFPETIFHGTDVGHQWHTTGMRYLEYLERNNLKDSEHYLLANKSIEQGKYFYDQLDHVYRENMIS